MGILGRLLKTKDRALQIERTYVCQLRAPYKSFGHFSLPASITLYFDNSLSVSAVTYYREQERESIWFYPWN